MNQLPPMRPLAEREFRFTDDDFRYLSALAGRVAGIHLSEAKRELVYARLARRLRQLHLHSFTQYCQLLEQQDPAEIERFINAITTNHTSFFRERHHFDLLSGAVAAEWLAGRGVADSTRLHVWCAGCSTGEEPYSVAMALLSAPGLTADRVAILATDLDSNVLATAARGVYPLERIEHLPEKQRRRWFLKGTGRNSGLARVAPELSAVIEFRRHNMILERPPGQGAFDVVFCRNVVIYFNKDTQQIVVERLRGALRPGGWLMVGHSESLMYRAADFQLVGQSTYRKLA